MRSAHREPVVSGPEQAAQAIVELINSRPRSPRPDEIADIIKKLAAARPPATCSHCDLERDLDREYGPATTPSP
jgi:hypothetical protein